MTIPILSAPRLLRCFALCLAIPPLLSGQTTVNLSNGDTNAAGYNTTGNTTTFTIDSGSATQSGVISGSGDVIKTGDGTVNFTAVNTHSGATIVSAGTLQLSATHGLPSTSGVTVEAGATLELNGVTVTIDSLAGAGDILLTTGFGNLFTGDANDHTISGNISGSGSLQKYGTGTLTLTGDNAIASMTVVEGTLRGDIDSLATTSLGTSAGSTLLFDQATDTSWAGALSGDGNFTKTGAGNLTLTSASGSFTGDAVVNAGTLSLGYAGETLGNTVDVTVATDATLTLGSSSETIGTLSLTGGSVTSSGGTLNADAFNVEAGTISAALGGKTASSGLTKTTTGTTSLTASAAYTGATAIQAGTLAISGSTAGLGATNAITIGDAATAALTVSGGASIANATRTITLGDTSTGNGTLSLANAPSSGYTLSNFGDIIVGNEGSGTFELTSSATGFVFGNVRLATGDSGHGEFSIDAGGLTLFGNLLIGEGGNATASATLTNNGTANVLSGYVEIGSASGSSGTLTIQNGANLGVSDQVSGNGLRAGSGSASITIDGGTLTATGTLTASLDIATSGTATFATGANSMALSGTISGDGTLAKTGAGTLTLTGTNAYSGGTSVSGGTLVIAADAALGTAPGTPTAGHLTLNGGTLATTATFTLATHRGIALGASGGTLNSAVATTLTYGGTLAGEGTFTKSGDGNLILSADHTHAGGTTVSAGTLTLGTGGATGSVTGNIANNGTVIFNRSGDRTYDGVVSGTGDMVHNGHILRLTAAQTYTGTTTINAGYLVLPTTVNQGLSASTHVEVASGATLDFSNSNLTLAGLTGAGEVYSFGGSAGLLTVNTAADQTQTFSGVLGSTYPNFALTKAGAGTLTLTGTNTYTGATTIDGGTLALGPSGSLASSSGLSLGSGGILDLTTKSSGFAFGASQTLSGTGTINLASDQSLSIAGTLAPGNSPGIITIDGNLVLNSSAVIAMELAGAGGVAGTHFDQLAVTGDLSFDGALQISLTNGYLPAAGHSFQLFTANQFTGAFASINLPGLSGAVWDTSLLASTGVLSVSAVPEPGTFTLLAGLGAFSLAAWRRRRRIAF